ncbi:uncharacterized protein LOC136078569 [Hydra vulgaris]|uniref:Uncharacterized protein LOC136078569 n=1 Tax=Hydra vulgaris TaxID=6087 RepID=A0ABM4BMW2_HYDVU
MKVKVKGVQARFLEMNPKVLYVPCANHSLNLVIVDVLQSSATSLNILASEIKATSAFLYEYRKNGFSDARIKESEIAEVLGVEKVFTVVRSRKKLIHSYECVDHTWQPEHQFKADSFLPLIDMSIASVKERFEQISIVTQLYDFLYRSESLIKTCNENSVCILQKFANEAWRYRF